MRLNPAEGKAWAAALEQPWPHGPEHRRTDSLMNGLPALYEYTEQISISLPRDKFSDEQIGFNQAIAAVQLWIQAQGDETAKVTPPGPVESDCTCTHTSWHEWDCACCNRWPVADIYELAQQVNGRQMRRDCPPNTYRVCTCTDDSPAEIEAFRARSAARRHIDVPTMGQIERERQTPAEVDWPLRGEFWD